MNIANENFENHNYYMNKLITGTQQYILIAYCFDCCFNFELASLLVGFTTL